MPETFCVGLPPDGLLLKQKVDRLVYLLGIRAIYPQETREPFEALYSPTRAWWLQLSKLPMFDVCRYRYSVSTERCGRAPWGYRRCEMPRFLKGKCSRRKCRHAK